MGEAGFMRKLMVASVVLAGLGGSAVWTEASAQKVAYLDSRKVFAEAPGAQEIQRQMQQEQQRLQTRIQSMRDSLATMLDQLQKQSVLLSPEERKKREDAYRAREQAMAQRADILQQEAVNRQEELMRPVMTKVESIIEELRKEGNYAIIFDAASNAMVSADTTLDLTTQVINRLKAAQPGSPPAANK